MLDAAERTLPMLLPLAGSGGADGCISKLLTCLSDIAPFFVEGSSRTSGDGEAADQAAAARALLADAIDEVDSDDVVWNVISHEWPKSFDVAAKIWKELVEQRVTEQMLVDALRFKHFWGYYPGLILCRKLKQIFGTAAELLEDADKFQHADETAALVEHDRFWMNYYTGSLEDEAELNLLLKLVKQYPNLKFSYEIVQPKVALKDAVVRLRLDDMDALKRVCKFGEDNWLARCRALEKEKEEEAAKVWQLEREKQEQAEKVQQLEREKQEVVRHNRSLQKWNKKLNNKLRNGGTWQGKPENS